MKCKLYLLWSLLLLLSSCFAQVSTSSHPPNKNTSTHIFRYTNPITRDTPVSMRDHCIIKVGTLWYCTGTSLPVWTGPNPGVRLLVSDDLIRWRMHSWLIDASKLPPDCPYNGRFLAPEINFLKKKNLKQ